MLFYKSDLFMPCTHCFYARRNHKWRNLPRCKKTKRGYTIKALLDILT